VAAASEKGDGFGAAAEGGTARLSEGGESRGRRRVRECKRIRSCWGRNCARGVELHAEYLSALEDVSNTNTENTQTADIKFIQYQF